jgi:hypothetical protein
MIYIKRAEGSLTLRQVRQHAARDGLAVDLAQGGIEAVAQGAAFRRAPEGHIDLLVL